MKQPSPIQSQHDITPENRAAVAIVKAINRWARHRRVFEGGRQFGVDYATWRVTFPQVSEVYQRNAEIVAGRSGRFLPRF